MRKIILVLTYLIFALTAKANDVYLAPTLQGGDDGLSCSSAHAYTFFNDANKWGGTGAGQIVPGTVVHICGGLGPYNIPQGTTFLVTKGNGTSGNPITVQFDPNVVVQSPFFGSNAVFIGNSFITFDGGPVHTGPGADPTDAVFNTTAMGTAFSGASQSSNTFNIAGPVSNIIIKNFNIEGSYVRLPPISLTGASGNGTTTATANCSGPCNIGVGRTISVYGISQAALNTNSTTVLSTPSSTSFTYTLAAATSVSGTGGGADDVSPNLTDYKAVRCQSCSNVTLDHLTVSDSPWMVALNSANSVVMNSEFLRTNHGVQLGCNSGAHCDNNSIHDNHFHDMVNWDNFTNIYHHDYIHTWGHQTAPTPWGTMSGNQIYNNLFDGDQGTNVSAPIFIEDDAVNLSIYNNVIVNAFHPGANTNGVINVGGRAPVTGSIQSDSNAVYDNVLVCNRTTAQSNVGMHVTYTTNFTFQNNIVTGCTMNVSLDINSTKQTIENNVYEDTVASLGSTAPFVWSGSSRASFTAWKSACLCDSATPASVSTTLAAINIDSSGHPLTNSVAIRGGANLSAIATGALAPLALDKNGVARPANGGGNWDAGAYQFQSSTIDFSSGFSNTGLVFNGSAALNGTRLRLTSGSQQAGSGWFTTKVNVQSFTTDFTFQLTNPNSDGITFAIQNAGATALGSNGGGLGYGGILTSVAVKFDLFQNAHEGNNSTGLYTNGASPTDPSVTLGNGVNLHSGDIFHVHLIYDGTTVTMTITDTVTNATFTTSWTINIPSTVGANSAYVGFTGGTGTATQEIITWTYGN